MNAHPQQSTSQPAAPGGFAWLTAREAAQHLKVRPRTLLLWVRQGKLKGYPLSGSKRRVWRFLREDLDAAVMQSVLPSSAPSVRFAEQEAAC